MAYAQIWLFTGIHLMTELVNLGGAESESHLMLIFFAPQLQYAMQEVVQ